MKAAARRGGFLLGLDGRIWACQGGTRRGSKRQKDPADITRRLEAHPRLGPTAPAEIRQELA